MVNMGVAMIQQDLPDDTEMLGITLGEFKKLAQITENEIKIFNEKIDKEKKPDGITD